jgi:Integrase
MKMLNFGYYLIQQLAASKGGRYSWCATTKNRWKQFYEFCQEEKVYDFEQVNHDLVKRYFCKRCVGLAISTAQNYISAINVVMKNVDEDWVLISPKNVVGQSRNVVRKKPLGFSSRDVHCSFVPLECGIYPELAVIVYLASHFGMRRREAILFDVRHGLIEAKKTGFIDVARGTKGGRGRYVERKIPVDPMGLRVLKNCEKLLEGKFSVVEKFENLKSVNIKISNFTLPTLKIYGIERLHDLRIFYACNRYLQITNCPPPCSREVGDPVPTHLVDQKAREIISLELGHSRMQIVSSYIGRKSRRKLHD